MNCSTMWCHFNNSAFGLLFSFFQFLLLCQFSGFSFVSGKTKTFDNLT